MRSTVLSRIPPRGMLIVAAALLTAVVNCEQVNVTAVDAARVDLQPQTTSIAVSQQQQITATVLSGDGKTLTGRTLDWTSSAPSIASVDNAGMVRGMAVGQATIRATSGDASGTATVNVTSAPTISANPTDVTFTAVQNGATPGDRTVAITNGGNGTLSGLTATVRYAAGQPTGWLTPSLGSTTAPTTLVLSANQRTFAQGTYDATVDIASSLTGITTRSITAHLTVTGPTPTIGLGTNSVTFTAPTTGPDPGAQTVGITNAGAGSLTGLSATIQYVSQATGWLTATVTPTTAPATLTLRAAVGTLSAGTYTANVRIASAAASNSPQTVAVTFTVTPPGNAIAIDQKTMTFAAARGNPNPSSQSAHITTQSTTPISGLTATVVYGSGQPTGWATATLSTTTTPSLVTVDVTTGALAAGTYTAQVRIAAANASNSPQNIDVTFNVADPLNAPNSVTATAISGSQINLSWAAPGGTVLRYRIERKTGAAGTYAVIDSTSSTSYQNTGLLSGTQYFYRVRACNVAICSAASTEVNATTGPSAPSSLTASAVAATEIDLTWGASTGTLTRYYIERKLGAAGTYAVIDSVASGTTTYANTSLASATQYFYRVRACNAGVCSSYSNEANATTGLLAPGAPASLTATASGPTQINLSWAAASGTVTRYRIERKIGAGGTYAALDSVANGVTAYSNSGLTPATNYFYRIQACNSGGCSPYSPEANATTPQAPPGAPTTIGATATSPTTVTVTWGAASGTVDYYKVERKLAGGAYSVVDSVAPGTLSSQSTGLTPTATYVFRVSAFNTAGSATSLEATVTTPPEPPTSLTATVLDSAQIRLNWTASASTVATYEIQRSAAGGPFAPLVTVSASTTTYQDGGLTASTLYAYQVRACTTGLVCSAFTAPASGTTMPKVPAVPTNLNATPVSASRIDLTWSSGGGTVAGYRIERSTTSGSGFGQIAANVSGTAYADSVLTASTPYFYRVLACNISGCSLPSAEATTTTFPNPPGVPTGLSASATGLQIALNWTGPSTGVVTRYQLSRATSAGGPFAVIDNAIPASPTLPYQNTGLSAGTQYFYSVQACNTGGCSGASNIASDTTAPPTPASINATAVSSSRIDVSWPVASGTATYDLERDAGGGYAIRATVTSSGYSDTGLPADSTYKYHVRACNGAGCSSYSVEASAKTFPPPPPAPTGLTAKADTSNLTIQLTWTASSGAVTHYLVSRGTTSGALARIDSISGGAVSYSDVTGLAAGTQYYYTVSACSASGCTASGEASALTVPPTPANFAAAIDSANNRVNLSWSQSNGAASYQLYFSSGGGSPFAFLDTVAPGNNLSYAHGPAAPPSTAWAYQIKACNTTGCSALAQVNAH